MVAEDRYCLDVVGRVNAASAGLRAAALLVLEAHLRSSAAEAVRDQDGAAAIREMIRVFCRLLRP